MKDANIRPADSYSDRSEENAKLTSVELSAKWILISYKLHSCTAHTLANSPTKVDHFQEVASTTRSLSNAGAQRSGAGGVHEVHIRA